jgi:GT2 family glycosyltransferase
MSSPPRVDVAIVNYFSAADVQRCLEVLGEWPHGTVWIVDNSHDAAELSALRQCSQERPWVSLIDAEGNLGFGRGSNLAFERSSAPLFLLLNPDARVAAQDLSRLAQAMQEDPRLGAVSPRIYWNEARTFLLPQAFPQTPSVALAQALAPRSRPLTQWIAARYLHTQQRRMASPAPFDVPFLAGAVMMLRRQAVVDAGGLFDPAYFMFYEDSDLSLRLRHAGRRLAIVPAAAAVHEYRHKSFKAGLMAESRSRYYATRYPFFHSLSQGLALVDGLSRPVPLKRWFEVVPAPCRTSDDLRSQTGAAGVVAVSPSPLMMPAVFRPLGQTACSFNAQEWALLEPGGYVALMQADGAAPPRWIHFERVA